VDLSAQNMIQELTIWSTALVEEPIAAHLPYYTQSLRSEELSPLLYILLLSVTIWHYIIVSTMNKPLGIKRLTIISQQIATLFFI
jgi:hypothetical protein